jgi:hypothetical protein
VTEVLPFCMKIACQITVYVCSLAMLWLVGSFMDTAFWQARFHYEAIFGSKPGPPITAFLIEHNELPSLLMLLPFLLWLIVPLLSRQGTTSYWEISSFGLRLAAFVALEMLVFLILATALFWPFLPYFSYLNMDPPTQWEVGMRIACWGFVVMGGAALIYRIRQARRSPSHES